MKSKLPWMAIGALGLASIVCPISVEKAAGTEFRFMVYRDPKVAMGFELVTADRQAACAEDLLKEASIWRAVYYPWVPEFTLLIDKPWVKECAR